MSEIQTSILIKEVEDAYGLLALCAWIVAMVRSVGFANVLGVIY